MKIALLGVTVVLVLASIVLVIASFRRRDASAGFAGMTGMTVMIAAAIPAVIYATLDS